MKFKCAIEEKDYMYVDMIGLKVRIEFNCEEPVLYLNQKDLSELIKHLQAMEETNK